MPGHEQADAAGATGSDEGQGGQGLDLPWLQNVEDRAAKPRTERLTGDQATQPAQPSQPIPATPVTPATPKQPQHPTSEAAAPPTEPIEDPPTSHPPPDPAERPPEWVVSILEPTASEPDGKPAQEYEQEELSHIMPWVHGEGAGRLQPGADAVATGGLPPWLSDITVQETLQSSSAASAVPAELGLDGIEPFVPPTGTGAAVVPPPLPEQAPDWLGAITGPERREPVEPALRRADLSTHAVLADADPITTGVEPVVRDTPVRSPREGAVETLAALIAPASPEAARWAVPGVEHALGADTVRRDKSRLFPDGLIYLIVMAALLAVLIVRPQFGDVSAPRASGVQPFYDAVERVGSSGVVLVVYDWDATRSAEMSLLAESVTRHLMSRRLRFVTVSTMPQGPGFAQLVTDRVRDDYPGYEYGRDYLVLGYLPGGQTGLAALMTNYRQTLPRDYRDGRYVFTNYPLFGDSRLEGLDSYALIINLAADEAELRSWIEQVGTRSGVPMVAAVPQGLEPVARSYLGIPRSGVAAVVSGPTGALQYTKLMEQRGLQTAGTGINSPTLTDRLNGQSIAAILVAAIILAALVGMVTTRRRT